MKGIFELFTNQFTLFNDPIIDLISMAIISTITFYIAWNLSPGGIFGSQIHWFFRFFIFSALLILVSILVKVIKLILLIPLYIWIILLIIFLFGVISYLRFDSNK